MERSSDSEISIQMENAALAYSDLGDSVPVAQGAVHAQLSIAAALRDVATAIREQREVTSAITQICKICFKASTVLSEDGDVWKCPEGHTYKEEDDGA
jgi:hypothetical protein